jgi:hypothetical protein
MTTKQAVVTAVKVVTLSTETLEVVVMAAPVSVLVMTVQVPSVTVVVTAVEIGVAMRTATEMAMVMK